MRKFRVLVEGNNFAILLGGKVSKHGFFATRFVEAKDSRAASELAMNLIGNEIKSVVLNDHSDPPAMYVEENEEIDDFGDHPIPGSGLTWFKAEETVH